jgi:hypothetical protein
MTGRDDITAYGLDGDRVKQILEKFGPSPAPA